MSETPTPYGSPSITQRMETVERQIIQVTDVQTQNANAIVALVDAIDRLRDAVEVRLTGVEDQLAALNRSNQLLAELITTRLPPPPKE